MVEDPAGTPIIIDHNEGGGCGDGDLGMQTQQAQLVVEDPDTTVSETGTGLVQTSATLAQTSAKQDSLSTNETGGTSDAEDDEAEESEALTAVEQLGSGAHGSGSGD